MAEEKKQGFERPKVDEKYLMEVISGEELVGSPAPSGSHTDKAVPSKVRSKSKKESSKQEDYEELFLVNHFPSGRNGKVVYIRPEYHERLLRMARLSREGKMTLYAYLDNILAHHFQEFGEEITAYFNDHFKPIL